jgi:hypothetical protein
MSESEVPLLGLCFLNVFDWGRIERATAATTEAPVLKVFKINFEFDVLIKKNKISGLI